MDKKLVTVQQTPDREKKIAEIREALEKATPGTWVYDDICDDIYADKTDVIVCNAVRPEDGPLIANAPEWFRFLLDELERLEQERNRLFERLKDITITLGGVTFTDGRQWGAYNALCDIVKDWQKSG